ncbi:MAG: GNAT family N-acetyltransferase [Candidatus Binatia bacterium]|nr:GNAT family N-acetyltransferase [Candidatus Binatia bacterium]
MTRIASLDITFQLAGRVDIAQLIRCMREYYTFDHLPFDEQRAYGALETLVGDESLGRVWLICAAGTAIGYMVLTLGYSLAYGGRDAFIDEIYIRESSRGQGIGTHALSVAEEMCRALGVRALHLEVERANSGAYSVYRKLGFVDHNRSLMTTQI